MAAKEIVEKKGLNEFSVTEILDSMHRRGTSFSDSTIKTHVTSRCCGNAPQNHGTKYDDFRRIGPGRYKLTYHNG